MSEMVSLQDISVELSDGLHAAPIFNPDGEYLFVNANNFVDGKICDIGNGKRCDKDEYEKNKIELDENTLFYSIDGTIGNVAKYYGEKCVLGKGACYIRLKPEINRDYIYYLLQSDYFRAYIKSMQTGSTIHHISLETMRNFHFLMPDRIIQDNISALLSQIDSKILLNNDICKNIESLAKEIYDYWFVQFDFPDENGRPYKSSGGKMVWSEELNREIPEGWEVKPLSDIFNITMGSSPIGESLNDSGDGIEFYQGSTDFGSLYPSIRMFTTKPVRLAKAQDVLLSVRAPVGAMNIAMNDCCIGRGLAAIHHNSTLYAWNTLLNLKHFFDVYNNNGTTFGALTSDDLKTQLTVKIPKMILDDYIKKVAAIEKQLRILTEENRDLTLLRDFLLPMLMNGQIKIGGL